MSDRFSEARLHRMAARTGLSSNHRLSSGPRRWGLGRSLLAYLALALVAAGLLYSLWRLVLWFLDRAASIQANVISAWT